MNLPDRTDIDLRSPAFLRDPYPRYAQLRASGPLVRVRVGERTQLMATRHADVLACLKDTRFGTEPAPPDPAWLAAAPAPIRALVALQRRWLLFVEPPTHTRLRALVHGAFTPRMVQQLAGAIEQRAHELLDAALAGPAFDLIAGYAHPLPVDVIARILGVPIADRAQFAHWSVDLGGTLDPAAPPEALMRGGLAAMGFADYLRGLIAQRRAAPGDDLLSALIAAGDAGDRLDEDELVATCVLLLLAGHETTQNLIGNGVHALLRHPGQLARLREEPALMRRAVEELLRFDSPVQCVPRIVRAGATLAGEPLPEGQHVWMLIGSAHRDPSAYPEPDTLDLGRETSHVAFGAGIHFCVGAMLARTEAQIALRVLLERLPGLRLAGAGEAAYRDLVTLRGLRALPVAG